jgi:toxin ParE1/3/4
MPIRWARPALRALAEHITYVAADDPDAAQRVRDAIVQAVELLATFPDRGRPGRRAGTRELVITGYPYIVVYRVGQSHITVLRVWHGRQNWQQ